MNAIITVVGTDQVGIIAKVSGWLAARCINIADISQTILSGNFVMMMMVDLSKCDVPIAEVRALLDALGGELGVSISIMHERVFSAMHRI
jgi:ACT domain-containing protein